MIHVNKYSFLVLLLACVAMGSACGEKTFVLVTVDVDETITEPITQIRFDSLVTDGTNIFNSDSQTFEADGRPIRFPQAFVVVANGWGRNGETVGMAVEAYNADGEAIARVRGEAIILEGEQSSTSVLLRTPCAEVSECLGGQGFCENPHRCECEGDDCSFGFCDPIATDDENQCTEFECDDLTQVANHVPVGNGDSCGTSADGDEQFCAQGLCKVPLCGDFIVDDATNEECDDGTLNSDFDADACRTTCKVPSCGDGVIDDGEECDDGAANIVVEDGEFVNLENIDTAEPSEACRQSVTLEDGSGEVLNCVLPRCGDGVLNGDERCDDHDSDNGDGCNPTCSLFGDVEIVAGAPGGPGDVDGVAEEASLRELVGAAFVGDIAYFNSGGIVPPQVLRSVSLVDGEVQTVAGLIGAAGAVDGIGAEARFSGPTQLSSAGTTVFIAGTNNNLIRTYDTVTGAVTTIAGTGQQGSSDGDVGVATLNTPVLVAAQGTTDVLFVEAGTSCRLRRLNRTTGQVSTLAGGNFPVGCPFPFFTDIGKIEGLVAADDGSFYSTQANIIRKIELDPLTFTTIAGGGTFGELVGNTDGDGPDARFSAPGLLAIDGDDLYVADLGNGSIRHIDLSANPVQVSTLNLVDAGTQAAYSADDVRALAVSGDNLLIARNDETQIFVADLSTNPAQVFSIAGSASNAGNVNDDGADTAIDSRFNGPRSLALVEGATDTLFVADSRNHSVRTVNISAGSPEVGLLGVADATLQAFHLVGAATSLFAIFDVTGLPSLRELDFATGTSVGLGATDVDMPVTGGVALLGPHLFVSDPLNSSILRIERASGDRVVFAGTSGADEAIVDGTVEVARFGAPTALVSCAGDLYVAESARNFEAHVIRKIEMSEDPEVVTTIAGFATDAGFLDGVGLFARFDHPEALACDDRDPDNAILYVADAGSQLIRQVELQTGRVSTLAGTPYIGLVKDGTGIEAGFNNPLGIVFDPESGDLFVADEAENVIRRIQ